MTFLTEAYRQLGQPVDDPELLYGADVDFGLDLQQEADNPLTHRPLDEIAPTILDVQIEDTALWHALFHLYPGWHWGHQGTGDCTSWGKKHGIDVLQSVLYLAGKIRLPEALSSQESIYGFAKCEVYDRYRRTGAGSTSWAVSEAARKYGWLLRKRYSDGRNEIDLREYSGRRAIDWGNNGGGVPDWLEPFAALQRATDRIEVANAMEAAKLITAGYPVDYAGNCPWPRQRDADGMAIRYSRGAHMMCLTGLRVRNGEPYAFWVANTGHGAHVTGPVGPLPVPEVYAQCGGWIQAEIVDRTLRNGRCCAHTMIDGFPVLDWQNWRTAEYL